MTELRLYGEQSPFGPDQLDSIYLGGGTPTTLSPGQLAAIHGVSQDGGGREIAVPPITIFKIEIMDMTGVRSPGNGH